jgi:adenylate cyclase class IV
MKSPHYIIVLLFCYPLIIFTPVLIGNSIKKETQHLLPPSTSICQFEKTRTQSEDDRLKMIQEIKKLQDEKFKNDLSFNFLDNFPDLGQFVECEESIQRENYKKR